MNIDVLGMVNDIIMLKTLVATMGVIMLLQLLDTIINK